MDWETALKWLAKYVKFSINFLSIFRPEFLPFAMLILFLEMQEDIPLEES